MANSTVKQYEAALRHWWNFCCGSRRKFFTPTVSKLLTFLTRKYNEGASYGTLNTFRCAISLISKDKIGENDLVSRFMKGIFKLRPTRPRYTRIWDVSAVLRLLETWHPLEDLELNRLTKKTVTLLALCTAHRAQTLANIKINNIILRSEWIEIEIPDRIKTSGPGRCQPLLILPKFNDQPKLCVASALIRYLHVTKALRGSHQTLFLAVKKPFAPVGAQSISRWIKDTLRESGIDVSLFKAHSVRHAATSSAFTKGIDLNTIRRTAGWTNRSQVFARFYNRPITTEPTAFARAVVSALI